MNCQKCIHSNVCKFTDKEVCKGTKVKDLSHDCKDYKESVIEVVRYKDCERYSQYLCDTFDDFREPDDFCSFGKRKTVHKKTVHKMNNYERIKNMSVEEMANLFEEISICCFAQNCNSCPINDAQFCCTEYIKIWLESEVEEE